MKGNYPFGTLVLNSYRPITKYRSFVSAGRIVETSYDDFSEPWLARVSLHMQIAKFHVSF